MAFPPKQDHRITLANAVVLTKAHQTNAPKGEVKGEMWPRDVFETLLAQPGCMGIRIYHGRGPKGEKQMVLVAVDSSAADMTTGAIMEMGMPCPPFCDAASPLQG
jgi:hypothetical protein